MRLVVVSFALLASACVPVPVKDQVWREIPATSAGQAAASGDQRLLIGDTVRVHTKDGKAYLFRAYKIEENAFYGIATDKKSYRIGYGALTSMEVKRTETVWEAIPVPVVLGGSGTFDVSPAFSTGAGSVEAWLLWLFLGASLIRNRPNPAFLLALASPAFPVG